MSKLDNITIGIKKLNFFENIGSVYVFEHDNIIAHSVELDFDNISVGIGEFDLFENIEFV